jgi:hypothetical protein
MATATIPPKTASCKRTLTAERVRELFHYEPETGMLTWLVKPAHRVKVGDQDGWNDHGYRRVHVDGRKLYVHDLAWLWMTGEWPKHQLDHIDLNRANNRLSNLRQATMEQNRQNHGRGPKNTSGFKWVCWDKKHRCWLWQIRGNGKRMSGHEASPENAYRQAVAASVKLHGEFARTK